MTILKMDDFIVRDRNLFKCFDEWHRIVLTFKKNFCFLFCDFFSPLMQNMTFQDLWRDGMKSICTLTNVINVKEIFFFI